MKAFVFLPKGRENCSVTAWIHFQNGSKEIKQTKYPAVVVCPGGGYDIVSDIEGEPVALQFYAAGYNVFVLRYSVRESAANFKPLCDLAATMAEIRANAEEWYTESDKIAVCGFSAGGHLAASLGVLHNEPKFLKAYGRIEHIRPDAMILCYPVITADEFAHVGSIKNVSGAEQGTERYAWFGLDKHVDAETSPAFLWHTAEDNCVPVENTLKMASALSEAKVPFEVHIFPKGSHGMSVCTQEVNSPSAYNARWMEWCIAWLGQLWS